MNLYVRIFLIVPLFILNGLLSQSQTKDFRIIKERVISELMKFPVDDGRVRDILGQMKEDGSFEGINYEDLSRTAGFPHRNHTGNLVYLARAWKNKESSFYKDKKLKMAITRCFKFWVDHDYVGDNWHDNQITTPTNLGNLMLIMGADLPDELVEKAQPMIGRANMNASGARPSGDRIVIAGILAKNLLFREDNAAFDEIIKIIEGEIKFSTGQRGMQHDYSFHHRTDRVNNTTSYGYGKYANAFGEWSWYVSGTRYAFSKEKINQLVDYYLDGIYKQMVYGIYTDISVKNRSISGRETFEPHGTIEIERLLYSTDYRKEELEEIIRLRKGEIKPSESFAKFFWQTEHFVFQRPDFYTTVRMFSTRNRNMEEPYNGPGKTTHHRADGTNYLMLKGDEYLNIWPVYDWQKISGTTILQKPQLYGPEDIQKDGLTDFVGAVTDDLYGAVAFDFMSPHDMTRAKKSWFFFDDEYVCLGAGIRSDRSYPVASTVNQALLKTDVTIMQDGREITLPAGSRALDEVRWVYHNRTGYILPKPAKVMLSNQKAQGRWSDITDQKNISKEVVSEDVFLLWFDHGVKPHDAQYAWIVVPNTGVEEIRNSYATNRNVEILANTPDIQGVFHKKLQMGQVAFYTSGKVNFTEDVYLELGSQGMAMVKLDGKVVKELTLADPSRKLDRMLVTLSGIYTVNQKGITTIPDRENNRTLIMAELPEGVYLGKSVKISL